MPYRDKGKQKEYWKDKKRVQRMSTPVLSTPDVAEDVHPKGKRILTRPNRLNGEGNVEMVENKYDANERLSDGRMRYLGPFSDGQVLDRLTVPPIDKTTAAYRVFSKCKMFTPNAEQLRENGIDLQSLMKPSKRGK